MLINPLKKIRDKAREEGVKVGKLQAINDLERQLVGTVDPYQIPHGKPEGAYKLDYPVYYVTPQSPRRKPTQILDSFTMRRVADSFDLVRAAIDTLKRQVQSQPRGIAYRSGKSAPDSDPRLKEAKTYFSKKGGLGGFNQTPGQFEMMVMEDLLVLGSYAVYHKVSLSGKPIENIAIDSATIRPRVDSFGWPDTETPFEQWIQGMQVARFAPDELTYDGFNNRSWTPYYNSSIEYLIATITSAMKADEWNRIWLTDGTAPGNDVFTLPAELPPDRVQTYIDLFTQIMSGNTTERQRAKFLPNGSQRLATGSRRDMEFNEYELWLLRRVCAVYGVQPASMGFSGEQYKVSQDASQAETTQYGAGAIMRQLKVLYDDILESLGYEDLEYKFISSGEESASDRAKRNQVAVGRPWRTVNEARAEDGLEPLPGGDDLYQEPAKGLPSDDSQIAATKRALNDWRKKCINRLNAGKSPVCTFVHDAISEETSLQVLRGLQIIKPDREAIDILFNQTLGQ